MGKKIPKSRKHKKLKFVDPCYTGQQLRKKNRKLLPNEPPTVEDYQEVPRYTEEIINLKHQVKGNKLKKKKKKKKVMRDDFIVVRRDKTEGDIQGSNKIVKNLPAVIKQKKYESEDKFFHRLQKMADAAIAEAKIEQKYNIELVNIDKKGNAEYVPTSREGGERKKEKRKMHKEREIEKKRIKTEEPTFDLQKEKIDFGEVVMAPPIFTAKPRKAPEIHKPGKKQLHLNNILESNKERTKNTTPLSTKWKNMPSEKRKIMENERLKAVEMYRKMKNKK